MSYCRHYTPETYLSCRKATDKQCKAGVTYAKVARSSADLPCVNGDRLEDVKRRCASWEARLPNATKERT